MASVDKSRSRGKMWSDEATRDLIQLWSEETSQLSLDNCKTSRETAKVYQTLLHQLKSKGYDGFTLKELINKMKKMRQKYKSEKDKTRRTGNGAIKKWKFFEEMDRFLGKRHNVTPPALADTMAESENRLDISEDNGSSPVNNLVEKYGQGQTFCCKCKTCTYEKDIHSSGVHITEGGSVMVYNSDDEFSCPNCDSNTSDQATIDCGSGEADIPFKEEDETCIKGKQSLPSRKRRKSNVEKSLEVVFEKFKQTTAADFERYQKLEEERIKKEHEFRIQQLQLENERRKEEREHELKMLSMVLGQQSSLRIVQPNYRAFPLAGMHMPSSSSPVPSSDSDMSNNYNGAPTYIEL